MILSNTDTAEEWQPSELFAPKDNLQDDFLKEDSVHDIEVFVPRSLVEGLTDAPSETQASAEETSEIEPLQPLEPDQNHKIDQSNIDIDKVRQEAFSEGEAKGIAEGKRLAQEELDDRQQQFEIEARDELQRFMSSIQDDLIHHNRLAEPLKRLAVALAEHIARAEVQLSDQSIDNLIERVVSELEPSELKDVVVTVSPAWQNRITDNQFDRLFEHYEIRVSEKLSDGSIRLSTEDRTIEDLIEERITQMASQVFNVKFPAAKNIVNGEEKADPESRKEVLVSETNEEIEETSVFDDEVIEEAVAVDQKNGSEEVTVTSAEKVDSMEETPFVMEPPELEDSEESPPQIESDD